jgi:predicted permease
VGEQPRMPPVWRRYLRFWGADPAADVDDELDFHISSRVEELTQQGMPLSDARTTALREFGDYASVRREVYRLDQAGERRHRITEWLSDIDRDARYALRSLRKAPGFSFVIVVTLSLGIGLNSTIFSLVNAYLFRPVALPNAERIVVIGNTSPLLKQPHEVPYRDLQAYRELRGVFEDLTGTVLNTESLNEGDRTDRVWIERTTGNYFSALRVPMLLGRGYAEDASNRAERVVVLSHEFWARRFSSDSSIVGRPLRIGGEPRTVIGIAAPPFPGFAAMLRSDAWSPIDESPAGRRELEKLDGDWFNVYGVLRPGISTEQARAAVRERATQLERDYPASNKDVEPVLVPEMRARPALAIASALPLMAAVLLGLTLMVLVVACANVASLLLARGTAKRRELAVQAALGASRWRLTRQAIMEVGMLSLAGALGAIALARVSTAALANIHLATDAPLFFDFSPDWRVLAFTLAAALGATLVAGLAPALRNAGTAPQAVLVAGGRSMTDRAQQRVRSVIVVSQIAVSAIVVIAAGLFARSMGAAETMELGFRTENLLLAQLDLELAGYDSTRARAFLRDVLERARSLPGVESAALAARVPFGYSNNAQRVVTETAARDNPDGQLIFQNIVSTRYFHTAGPPIIRGREFTEADDISSPRVAVVNEVMAQQMWPGQDPIGKIVRVPQENEELRVVGVARSAQYMFLGESPRPFFWTALAQHRRSTVFLEIATVGAPKSLSPTVQRMIREMDPNVPLFDVRTMAEHLRNGRAMFAVRLGALFGGAFAILTLALATIGLYGLVSYNASHRTREIGIRIAVGATMRNVVGLIIRHGIKLALMGVLLGAVAALGITHLMASLLFGVGSRDPLTFVFGPVVLALASAIASWIPARRAAAMDPVRALRLE